MAKNAKPQKIEPVPPPSVKVPGSDAPVKVIKAEDLAALGQKLKDVFTQYTSDRKIAEQRWLRNQRQYLGIYDPDIEKELSGNRSQAYPRITRIKCVSVLSRLMNLMFPGNERNWSLTASPSPDMNPGDVIVAMQKAIEADKAAQKQTVVDDGFVQDAVQRLAEDRAGKLSKLIDDQLQELGGGQDMDYVALNRKVVQSGVVYGLGVLRGPFATESKSVVWSVGDDGKPAAKTVKSYKPMFEFLPVWDFYPDMSAKTLASMDGYFTRAVMTKAQVRALANRSDFFPDQIKKYLKNHATGNYKAQTHETELRAMGVKINVNEQKTDSTKYEIVVWHGVVSATMLASVGVDVADDKMADDIDAEVWTIDGNVIKAIMNPWVEMGVDVRTVHTFLFDEDDTSPVGFGVPNAIRDSQMSICAAARMLLDNASVTCGPQLELNTDLLRPDQDLVSTGAYKIWYREGNDANAQFPAVRNISIDAHIPDLMKIVELFMQFADAETFVGPATGGDMSKGPSEPFRTAAGASMLRGDAALPFKDVVRNFDRLTQSVIGSLVQFNKKFNEKLAPAGDYNVIARGATSLIAKEIRGIQIDQLATTLTPGEMLHVDDRKMAEARFKVRDLDDFLVSEPEAERRRASQDAANAATQKQQADAAEATVRKILSEAFKNISQGQKNSAASDAATVKTALDILEKGLTIGQPPQQTSGGGLPPQAAGNA